MQRTACPHCVMPLPKFAVACPRCGRATPFAGTLPWLGAAVIGLVVLLVFAAVAWIRIEEKTVDPNRPVPDSALTLAPAPPRGMVASLDSAEAAHAARTGGRGKSRPAGDTVRASPSRPSNMPDTSGIEINAHPPDPRALDGVGPREQRRSALEALLRRGLADSLRERSPSTVQMFVGRAFFRQPAQFRNPLMKALDSAWTEGSKHRNFELWWDTFRLGDYARDTFKFGKWYYEFR